MASALRSALSSLHEAKTLAGLVNALCGPSRDLTPDNDVKLVRFYNRRRKALRGKSHA